MENKLMKKIFILLLCLPTMAFSQGRVPFAVTASGLDTAYTNNLLKLTKYANGDATKFLSVDAIGRVILAVPSGGGGSADSTTFATQYRVDSMRVNIYGQVSLKLNKTDTASHWIGIGWLPALVKYADTASMLNNYVRSIRSLTAGFGLIGGGTLAANRTIEVDTTEIPTMYNVDNAAIYPEVQPMGVIYEKSSWNLAEMGVDFLPSGGASVSLNGNYVRITSTADAWTSQVRFRPYAPTLLNNWSFTVDFKIISSLASNTGFGPMIKTNNVVGAVGGYSALMFTNGGNLIWIYREDGVTPVGTGAIFAVAQNDVIRMKYSLLDSVLTVDATNLTTGLTGTVSGPLFANAAPSTPNTGTLGFVNFKGTYDVMYTKFESNMPRSGNVLYMGDSKGAVFANYFGLQTARRLNATYPVVANYSGGGDRVQDLIDKKAEILSLNYEKPIILCGSNDIRYGASVATTMERIAEVFSWYEGTSTQVFVSVIPEDSTGAGIGLTAFKNALESTYPDNYIDLWTPLSTGNILDAIYNSGDDIHPNNAAQPVMEAAIIASGLITPQSANRRTPYQTNDNIVAFKGNNIGLNFNIAKGYFNMPRWDDTLNLVPSFIKHTNSYILISPNLITYTRQGAALLSIDGEVAISGSTCGLVIYDRDGTGAHGFYENGDVLRMTDGTGSDAVFWNSTGKMRVGYSAGTPTIHAILDLSSTTAGFLPPRMTATQGSALSNLEEGLMIYVTDTNGTFTAKGWWGYNGAAWEKLNN